MDKIGSFALHQTGLSDMPEHRRQLKKQQCQEDERRRLAEYKHTSKHDVSIPSTEIIYPDDDNEEQTTDDTDDEQDGKEHSYELTATPDTSDTSSKKPEYNM